MKSIYLDYNATAPMPPEVLEAMLPYLTENYGNASSLHQLGQKARKAIEDARSTLANFINAENPDEIIFTSGGTESNNMAIKGAVTILGKKSNRVVSTTIEHSAVKNVLTHLSYNGLVEGVFVPVNTNGVLDISSFKLALTPETVLVTVMAANNEVGTLQPVAEIGDLCRAKQVPFHTDAVQLAGKGKIDVREIKADMLSLSAHKFGGPKGIGLLYVRKGTRLDALIHGGKQEKNRRGGTENVAGIVGMAKASEIARQKQEKEAVRIKILRDDFESTLLREIPSSFLNGEKENRVSNTTNIGFEFTDSSETLMALDLNGVVCSNGSACQAGSPEPSHVLKAMGLTQDKAHASLRFSMGSSTTKSDLDSAIEIIKKTVQKLRENHPLWKEMVAE